MPDATAPLPVPRLQELVAAGEIDTVVACFTDMQGRLQGKRLHAAYFVDVVLDQGVEGCNYLLGVDVDMNTVDGYAMTSWDKGYGDMEFVLDERTIRMLTHLPATAMVQCDLVWMDHSPVVQSPGRDDQAATTVLFDPKLDVAVLHVHGSLGPVLALDVRSLPRGSRGAVLGYPGGGPLTAGGAAVRRSLSAIGRDVYGRSIVDREVYELEAIVRPGNSGGPFLLPSGAVGGIVFAASTTDGDVAYALTAGQVAPDIRRGTGRTRPVSTQDCIS